MTADPYCHQAYEALHATPMQARLRRHCPMPIGCVFLPWPGMTEQQARWHLRTMRELGFTCLKQTMATPDWPTERTLKLALEEDIWPFWYGEAGFREASPELLNQLGLDPSMDPVDAWDDPTFKAWHKDLYLERIDALYGDTPAKLDRDALRAKARQVPGVVGDMQGHELHPDAIPHFISWLQDTYGDVESLKQAWNAGHVGLTQCSHWTNWDQVAEELDIVPEREYRHLRDIMRFRADTFIANYVTAQVDAQQATDPDVPVRAGGEMGIFLPFASRGTDMEGMAKALAPGGSFYPSIHLTWHFEEVAFEVARPVYMQAALTHDWGKGIWTATWESSGGPSWFSGGKAPFVPWAQDKTPGHSCDAGGIAQLMLSWLAAGYKGFGLWCWNHRTAGWESGEFTLLDRNHRVTDRARRAGAIGTAARRWRRELWSARKEPQVGLLQDWENEAMWAAMGVTGRDHYKSEPIRARIGASRALIDAQVPFEHVTPSDLRSGLGARYRCIYLPAFLALTDELLADLTEYVENGGRVVLDMPAAYLDGYGRVLSTAADSAFGHLFGVELSEYRYARDVNTPFSIAGTKLDGFVATMQPTEAAVVAHYDQDGSPAITEHRLGAGSAVVLGCQASLNCHRPGNTAMQHLLTETCGGDAPFRCDGALLYHLSAPEADHVFLVNDQDQRQVAIATERSYRSWTDAETGETIDPAAIELNGWDARWLRAER
ncbi:MAG: beta-galactosidase trimerization domain-containing protein [Planctomycetota bacterium]|nr:beta-galactosidase trimerization domain-containing protein [Planctomycetota bacterium]